MKYAVILGDGMADEPLRELDGKTPLEYAKTPAMDALAAVGRIGMVRTIPEGMSPGSDTANLSVLGYDPKQYYTGRSPLEALSIGVPMEETDIAFRCNLVTLSQEGDYADKVILDHSSGEISTEEAAVLLKAVADVLQNETYQFYTGTSYRHCLIRKGGSAAELTPPHDILDQRIGAYLPEDEELRDMMERSWEILSNHPLNAKRMKEGKNPANSIWFWGAGTKPVLSSFEEKFGKKGAMVSAVDLLKGIAVGASMTNITVEGANGGLNTNYEGKAQAAADALLKDGFDFVYVHLEAPDEMGHQGSYERKIQAIEYLDGRILAPLVKSLDASGEDYRIAVLPDHPTPVRLRTHTADAVPYLIFDSRKKRQGGQIYCERTAAASGEKIERGCELMKVLLEQE